MAGQIGTQTPFTGQLTTNEIYNALNNWIINQRIFDIEVDDASLAEALKVDGTLFGDTYTYYSGDIGTHYDWGNDGESSRLLEVNRNTSQKVQSITLDVFKQATITLDNYLTKRAWSNPTAFSQFNSILLGTLSKIKKVYENGLINTFVGTQMSTLPQCKIVVDLSGITAPTTTVDDEAKNRLEAQSFANTLRNISFLIKDNTRDYNEYKHIRSVAMDELFVVWRASVYNRIMTMDLPTIFNKDDLKYTRSFSIPDRYFGTIVTTAGTSTGTQRVFNERDYGSTGGGFLRFGDLLASGATYNANEVYNLDETVVAKIFPKEAIPFMSAMSTESSFYNPRSLTENHYVTWAHNTLQRLMEFPFISLHSSDPIPMIVNSTQIVKSAGKSKTK